MKKEWVIQPDIKLVGLSIRTNNKNEMNSATAKIAELVGGFWSKGTAANIQHRKHPGKTYSVYTDYASDEHGDYTYFIGEEVTSFDNVSSEFNLVTIPAAKYQKFTTQSGKMPEVVINAWQQIWKMTPDDFGGRRAYQADFEIYDERAHDPSNAILDIYIGIV